MWEWRFVVVLRCLVMTCGHSCGKGGKKGHRSMMWATVCGFRLHWQSSVRESPVCFLVLLNILHPVRRRLKSTIRSLPIFRYLRVKWWLTRISQKNDDQLSQNQPPVLTPVHCNSRQRRLSACPGVLQWELDTPVQAKFSNEAISVQFLPSVRKQDRKGNCVVYLEVRSIGSELADMMSAGRYTDILLLSPINCLCKVKQRRHS